MNIDKLIEDHDKAMDILLAIKATQRRLKLSYDSLNGYPGTFPDLAKKYRNNIEIRTKAIERLTQKYIQWKQSAL